MPVNPRSATLPGSGIASVSDRLSMNWSALRPPVRAVSANCQLSSGAQPAIA
jgi:hypothetical protein